MNRKIAAKNTPVLQSQNPLQKSGELIELGGWQKNIGICVATIGSAIGGTMLGVGLAHGYKGFTVTGSVIIAATGLAGFVLDICGNKNIELGGKVLKEMEFSNDGINLKF